jgi:sugar/nucleoside kinase (ribokinase family)
MSNDQIDLLAIGETLIDFISLETAESLSAAEHFRRHLGGSPANITVTVARLGGRAAIASKVGAGAFGTYVRRELEQHGVITDYLRNDPTVHTTVVFVARTPGTPDFEAFRAGDAQLRPDEVPEEVIARAAAVHASTFALSREPCRSAIISSFRRAAELGKIVSLDPNYDPRIWRDIEEARTVLRELYRYVTITKPSLDDAKRLFGLGLTPEAYIEQFHALGPQTVVFTLGREGVLLSHAGQITHVPARAVNVVDATGAGDAFWGGFLKALVDGLTPLQAAYVAREVVARKLTMVGPLSENLDRAEFYRQAQQSASTAAQ